MNTAAIVAEIAHRLIGGASVQSVIAEVKDEFASELADLEARIEARITERFQALGFVLATNELATGTAGVVDAFTPKGALPNLFDGADVQEVKPIDDWDGIKTPAPGDDDKGDKGGTGGNR